MRKIILAGGTGFLGTYLKKRFEDCGDDVIVIARSNGDVRWDDGAGIDNALDSSDAVINLAGKSVDCRYNEKNRREILDSRVGTTEIIGNAITRCGSPPRLWINSSTATIYRHAEDRPMTEDEGEIGHGFSVDVAKAWEKSFFNFDLKDTRRVALRMAIVLGRDGGALMPLKKLTQMGMGGRQGSGGQMFSWIHIEDVFRIITFVMDRDDLRGVLNCSSPNPVSNSILMETLRDVMHKKMGMPMPEWLLKIGAALIRTETELILKSRWVLPDRLLSEGFEFKFPELRDALEDNIGKHERPASGSLAAHDA